MKQKGLSILLKIIIVGAAVVVLLVYVWILPVMAVETAETAPAYSLWLRPCLIFVELTAVPVIAAIVLAWKIAANIGKDKSFCAANAEMLKAISILAIADTAYFFIGNMALISVNVYSPPLFLALLFITFVGTVITVCAAVLSHLVRKAADLQEQSDLTI